MMDEVSLIAPGITNEVDDNNDQHSHHHHYKHRHHHHHGMKSDDAVDDVVSEHDNIINDVIAVEEFPKKRLSESSSSSSSSPIDPCHGGSNRGNSMSLGRSSSGVAISSATTVSQSPASSNARGPVDSSFASSAAALGPMGTAFLSRREGVLERALEQCKGLVDKKIDGDIIGNWLLISLNHWCMEQERIVLLTQSAIYRVKYDFLKLCVIKFSRNDLNEVKRIVEGPFTFPENSVTGWLGCEHLQHSDMSGVRLFMSLAEPSFWQRWNPLIESSFATYRSHSSHLNDEDITDVNTFVNAILSALKAKNSGFQHEINGPILLDSYIGMQAIIYNDGELGICKARNGIGF